MSSSRFGYLGGAIIKGGRSAPRTVGSLVVVDIPRLTGLDNHVANVKRQNILLDAATIMARYYDFLGKPTLVKLTPARLQNFGASGGLHAAHAVKRYTFDDKDIAEVFTRPEVDETAVLSLRTMLGLVTDVHYWANLSVDKRLENNPKRHQQIIEAANTPITSLTDARKMAIELEYQRRHFELGLLRAMLGKFGDDDQCAAMLQVYEDVLSAQPQLDETPALMIDMIARTVES